MRQRVLAKMAAMVVFGAGAAFGMGAAMVAAQEQVDPPPALSKQEQAFAEKLSGAALVGRFTVDGKEADAKEERYEISKVSKLRDDYWVFNSRVKYGTTDVTVPITLKVLWAGDTPMISMTDLAIPGLGTFTCRVFFHEDRYAGTWQHGEVGGHMFGRIEAAKP
ncbi:MAG: hypothetical protein WD066_18130 [Planctomycetaceae bacterium]